MAEVFDCDPYRSWRLYDIVGEIDAMSRQITSGGCLKDGVEE